MVEYLNSVVTACGSYLPENVVTNLDLEKKVETSHDWIVSRTGIEQRHIVAEGETSSMMATKAAEDAISRYGINKDDIDLIIVATTTPDKIFPATATLVQKALGIKKGAAFDVQAVCAGFLFALATADSYIKNNLATNVLVIGVDAMSTILDWSDRKTCVLFGDGAGAVVLSKKVENKRRGVLGSKLYSDGSYSEILYADIADRAVRMNGQEVFKNAVSKMYNAIIEILQQEKLSLNDIKYLIPHQANVRILEYLAEKAELPKEKLISTVALHANTSAASIPLALDYTLKNKEVKEGDLLLLTAIGGGLSWGSALIRW